MSAASSFNVIGSGGSGGLTNANSNLIISDINAGLTRLQNNGGPTQTIALATTSPAIGAGTTAITGVTVPSTDQRGGIRTTSTIDAGAYQSGAIIPPPIVTPAATTTTTTTSTKAATPPPPVVLTTTVPTPVTPVVVTPLVKVTPVVKKASKVKTKVAPKKSHPGVGAAQKFHKAAVTKANKHAAVAKGSSGRTRQEKMTSRERVVPAVRMPTVTASRRLGGHMAESLPREFLTAGCPAMTRRSGLSDENFA